MNEFVQALKGFGAFSLDSFWFPLLIWTACTVVAFLILHLRKEMNPLFQYHLRAAAFLSLPLGILFSFLLNMIPVWIAAPELETAFFIINNPIETVTQPVSGAENQSIMWNEPSVYIGVFTVIILAVSVLMLGRLLLHFAELRRLYRNLTFSNINLSNSRSDAPKIQVAFHNHLSVPFTFGWKNPVVVLPEILKNDSEKLEMALQHELTHIRRGDYLLQLALSVIESLFWFHPLIQFGSKEINTYREISCDQEVLSKSNFSVKSYANLLYELVPLNSGVGRLSVSMAVQNSTLKKRIKTMKYHKLYKTSFKQSIFFLLLMVVGITLPIACSDLRGPESVSNEELEQAEMNIQDPVFTVNDIKVDLKDIQESNISGLGAILILSEYGAFKIAPRKFDGSVRAGKIDGNTLTFRINELNGKLSSSSQIISGISDAPVWVKHDPDMDYFSGLLPMKNALDQAPPPPTNNVKDEDLGDYFVVVEEMPKPIGGMAAIQSKVQYPAMARRAGIEGSVTVQFLVNEEGAVEHAKVVRGIGGGCDEEALRVVEQTEFIPGKQRGRPVKVQLALSVNFRLTDADFKSVPPPPPTQN